MKAVEISNLDQHLKPLQVDGISTPVELSAKGMRVSENTTFSKDLSIEGDLYVLGSMSDIKMTDGVSLETTSTAGSLSILAKGVLLASNLYAGDGSIVDSESTLALSANTGYDAKIKFMEAATTHWTIGNDGSESPSLFVISNSGTLGTPELTIDSSGLVTATGDIVAGDDIAVASGGKLNLDGIGGHTVIYEHSDDHARFTVGGDDLLRLTEAGDDGNQVHFYDSSAGFTQKVPTYNATTTSVDFRFSNKQFVTFGAGNITNIVLTFPAMSGNFVLLLKQDGTGSRTITNWKAAESDESAADGSGVVVWAGGSNPTLTTDANHVDILSFYWDADNEIAYGVATLDFQF